MTKKDCIAISSTIDSVRKSYSPSWDQNLFRACDDIAIKMADWCAQDNPRFDRMKFLTRAGVQEHRL